MKINRDYCGTCGAAITLALGPRAASKAGVARAKNRTEERVYDRVKRAMVVRS